MGNIGGGGSTSKTIKGTVYASEDLESRGYNNTAISVMADWLRWVFDFHGYDYEIYEVPYEGAPLDHDAVTCDDQTAPSPSAYAEFTDWVTGTFNGSSAPRVEKDFNLCLTNIDRGEGGDGAVGCAAGKTAVIEGGYDVAQASGESPQRYTSASPKRYKAIRAGIHEVAHCLGVSHDCGHASVSDANETWRVSPMYSSCPENECGYSIPCRPSGYTKKWEHTYCACALENFTIQ